MYGDDASFINPNNMMEVAKTMNKMFLSKWGIGTIWGWGKNFSPAVYILINMKKTNNEALGELIDSLIEITIAPDSDDDVSEQLEPIIEGLVSLCQGRDINDPVLDMKKLIDLYLMDEMMRALKEGRVGQA